MVEGKTYRAKTTCATDAGLSLLHRRAAFRSYAASLPGSHHWHLACLSVISRHEDRVRVDRASPSGHRPSRRSARAGHAGRRHRWSDGGAHVASRFVRSFTGASVLLPPPPPANGPSAHQRAAADRPARRVSVPRRSGAAAFLSRCRSGSPCAPHRHAASGKYVPRLSGKELHRQGRRRRWRGRPSARIHATGIEIP